MTDTSERAASSGPCPPLILLPGLDGTGALYRPLLDVIPPHVATRVISYPPDEPLVYPALLRRLEEQLRAEPDMVLVAESFSGSLALRYAAAHGVRVRAVVLCASFVRPPAPRWLRHGVWSALFAVVPPAFAVRRLMIGRDASAARVRLVREAIRGVHPRVLAARLREVLTTDCTDALRRCRPPILYLAPSRDALVGRSSVAAIAAARPEVTVRQLDGPHLLLQAEPAAAWREVAAFLEEAAPCEGGWG